MVRSDHDESGVAASLSLRFDLPEGTSGVAHVATNEAGLPASAFGLDPSLVVRGGRLRTLLDRLPDQGTSSPAVKRVVALVRGDWAAVLAAFTRDFSVALDFTVAHPEHVSDAFGTAVVCALWSRRSKSIPKLVALTRTNRSFGGSLRGQDSEALLAHVQALAAEG